MESDPQSLSRYPAAVTALEIALVKAVNDCVDGIEEVAKAQQALSDAQVHFSDLQTRRDDLAAAIAVLSALE